ncbi:hypothetical protein KOSB73_20180 [Klebsiella grimontii]|uniref:Uncharacterized protein n=1 Tax=Klebsiella grimontii TaxID=2058152 RepID=A0A285AXI9_9ENTR|nr:hypothetical protein KOSB73_20180 [Klebsiella grimontii]
MVRAAELAQSPVYWLRSKGGAWDYAFYPYAAAVGGGSGVVPAAAVGATISRTHRRGDAKLPLPDGRRWAN